MKNPLIITFLILLSSCAYREIGDLTMISNGNIDSNKEYVLIERNVKGKGKIKKHDALERAVDDAAEAYNGDYLMNVRVFVKGNGKKIKVEGDVWGLKATHLKAKSPKRSKRSRAISNIILVNGVLVTFKSSGKYVEGTVVGVNNDGAKRMVRLRKKKFHLMI